MTRKKYLASKVYLSVLTFSLVSLVSPVIGVMVIPKHFEMGGNQIQVQVGNGQIPYVLPKIVFDVPQGLVSQSLLATYLILVVGILMYLVPLIIFHINKTKFLGIDSKPYPETEH